MNNLFTLEKRITLDHIRELINVSVEEKLSYLHKENGVLTLGKIYINGVYQNENGIEKKFSDDIDVDTFIDYQNITDLDNFSISVDDFDYKVVDEDLLLNVKLKINSYTNIITTFPTEEKEYVDLDSLDDLEDVPAEAVIVDVLKKEEEKEREDRNETIPFLSEFLETKKYNTSSIFHVYKSNESLEDICQKYQITMEDLKRLNKETFNDGDLINIPLRHE